jgi:predicted phosphodiesterase
LGLGRGSFAANVNYPTGVAPVFVAVSDFNGDGKLDLVSANFYESTVSVLMGIGDGTFAPSMNYAVGTYPYSVVAGDFNGDGRPDLATADSQANTISLLFNSCQ